MKKNLFLSISLLFLGGLSASEMARVRAKHIFASHGLGAVTLRHDGMGFHVRQGGALHKVESYDVDPVLRKINKSNLGAYLKQGKIGVVKLSDGSFALHSHMLGLGGGAGGAAAGCWFGKFATHLVVQGVIGVVGLGALCCGGPAFAGAVVVALEKTVAVPVEVASNAMAIAAGIAGGVVTGPV